LAQVESKVDPPAGLRCRDGRGQSASLMAWTAAILVRHFLIFALGKADIALPSSVVVHGRRGRNSNINGVYIRDSACEGRASACYRRPDHAGGQPIFLYFEGEWRLGLSPDDGSVWAFARSVSPSPLLIDRSWEVWDGQRVVQDPHLRVSDLSLIPQVLLLSFDNSLGLQQIQGVLMQQPGLWDGRPYYKHTAYQELYLLCSVAEGHWRLGPLPLQAAPGRPSGPVRPLLLSRSPATLPQEIVEPWMFPGMEALPEGAMRLTPVDGVPLPRPVAHPRHVVIEGLAAGKGVGNGVYRLVSESNGKPVYNKADAVRAASLWFARGDWRIGPSVEDGRVWAHATADLPSDASWKADDGSAEEVRILDARVAIPHSITISGTEFVQESRLCDARPVYGATLPKATGDAKEAVKVFLYFRAHESEWWLGPEVGGSECLARARGSLFHVIPPETLKWHMEAMEAMEATEVEAMSPRGWLLPESDLDIKPDEVPDISSFLGLVCSLATAMSGIALWSLRGSWITGAKKSRSHQSKSETELACVVCLEAPRQILLMPCRHVCCCKECSERLERCPMCRTETTSLAEVFL